MLALSYFLLKMIICSGLLYGGYLMVLRNKIFHTWNRFYLLGLLAISLTAPLIKINIFQKSRADKPNVIHLLEVVNTNDEFIDNYTKSNNELTVNYEQIMIIVYSIISLFLLMHLFLSLYKIHRLKHAFPLTYFKGFPFINTDDKSTPFSFFNIIFWNTKIDINTSTGQQIFYHEAAHIQEKHSYDKMFINMILVLFWINPFFWLVKTELNMIHEFIADRKALKSGDANAFASMILETAYPRQRFALTNNFFYSPIKRRLIMLTKSNLKVNYAGRLSVLFLTAIIFLAFSIKIKTIETKSVTSAKIIKVIIDAGHGGEDKGASINNINEKDLTLAIAKKIQAINTNPNIKIILSRDQDQTLAVKDRVKLSESSKADLFISIHINNFLANPNSGGLSIMIPTDDNIYLKESKTLGSDILNAFTNNYSLQVMNKLIQPTRGVWILTANNCPSVLIEAGVLDVEKDRQFLTNQTNQEIIAGNILEGIKAYVQALPSFKVSNIIEDTLPVIQDTATLNKNIRNVPLRGARFIDTKNHIQIEPDTLLYTTEPNETHININKALVIIDGKIKNNKILKEKTITAKKLTIHSGDDHKILSKYGEAAKNGVFVFEDAVITDSKPYYPQEQVVQKEDDKIFTEVEVEAEFPGGEKSG